MKHWLKWAGLYRRECSGSGHKLNKVKLKKIIGAALSAFLLASSFAPVFAQVDSNTSDNKKDLSGAITHSRPKVALVLGGGGLRSASCIGVLKALEDEEIPVDIILGSSMGAVVGGLYAAGVTPNHIEEQFTKKKLMSAYLTIPLKMRVIIIPLFYTPRLVGIEPYDGLYSGKRFANYLNKQVPETERNIEDLKVPFGAVAVNLLSGKAHTFKQGNLGKALQASCAIPALRKPVKVGDGLYVDGGVLVNLPVKEAREMGADIVVAVDVDEQIRETKEHQYRHVGSVSHRVVALHLHHMDREAKAEADISIEPEVSDIGLISTSEKDARQCIEAGLKAGHKAAPAIRDLMEKYTH